MAGVPIAEHRATGGHGPSPARQSDSELPAWVMDSLACPSCRAAPLTVSGEGLQCRACKTSYPSQAGLVRLVDPKMQDRLALQQEAWKCREKARGQDARSPDAVPLTPDEPRLRPLFEWFRTILRRSGSCRVLEIGAGPAWASGALAEDGHDVVATDILDDPRIGLGAVAGGVDRSVACVLAAAERLPFRSASFDFVFCFQTLRHIIDLECVLHEVGRVLRAGGVFIAFDEPFRGALTTQAQRLQDCITYRLARAWQAGALPGTANPEILRLRRVLNVTLHESSRRVPFCTALAQEVGLRTTILPVDLAPSLPASIPDTGEEHGWPASLWLDSFATAFGLEGRQLAARCSEIEEGQGLDLKPLLLKYWCLLGNCDAVLIARKEPVQDGGRKARAVDLAALRNVEPLLLAVAAHGFVPVYGVHPAEQDERGTYHWIQPQAGFLVAGTRFLEITLACPPPCFRTEPIRIDICVEDEPLPVLVAVALPGKTVALKMPLPKRHSGRPSILIRLSANLAFIPSDYAPGQCNDMRLLALQLRSVHTGSTTEETLSASVARLQTAQAADADQGA